MQGRITKVLNNKPIETLGMIEEAAGTRMFETRKQQAIKTIEKKEAKRAEIQQVAPNYAKSISADGLLAQAGLFAHNSLTGR